MILQVNNFRISESHYFEEMPNEFILVESKVKGKVFKRVVASVKKWLLKKGIIEPVRKDKTVNTTQSVHFSCDKFLESIHAELCYFASTGEEIGEIIIGRSQMDSILNTVPNAFQSFYLPQSEGVPKSLMGTRLILNPYMDGIVFVPKRCM